MKLVRNKYTPLDKNRLLLCWKMKVKLRESVTREICRMKALLLFLLVLFFVIQTKGYQQGDNVEIMLNRIWKYEESISTSDFSFYSKIPLCQEVKSIKDMSFNEIVRGDQIITLNATFGKNELDKLLCTVNLNYEQLKRLGKHIRNNYVFEIYVEDKAIAKTLGVINENGDSILITGYDLIIGYKGSDIVSLEAKSRREHMINIDKTISIERVDKFSMINLFYSVEWVDVTDALNSEYEASFHNEIKKQVKIPMIRWLGVFNSVFLTILIISMLLLIFMQVLRSEFSRYFPMGEDDLNLAFDDDPIEMKGWKLLHGDIFRSPKYRMILSSFVGNGFQILFVGLIICITNNVSMFRNLSFDTNTVKFLLLLFTVSSYVSGYVSSYIYISMGGRKFKYNIFLTCFIYVFPVYCIVLAVKSLTLSSGLKLFDIFYSIKIFLLYSMVSMPLCFIGGLFGKKKSERSFKFPCKTNRLPRQIPKQKWYNSQKLQLFISGLIPFSAIYVELHYLLISFWNYTPFYFYNNKHHNNFLLLTISTLLLILVGSTSSIILIYIQLNLENYKWWWFSFLNGLSPCLYFFLFSLYYFFSYSNHIFGFIQLRLFILSNLVITYTLILALSSITFVSSYLFIHYIYKHIKSD
ncbi:integral membrane [Cryptosporidium bovis]|uniref:integral membrane n=1 Tax=Cryptosporidium bovis TaxID=310047 RepID=UPI00351A0E68|nr:integral membrane [Cryptosporidium bovis]